MGGVAAIIRFSMKAVHALHRAVSALRAIARPYGCSCPTARPAFLKSPTSSFFFVSTEIAGWPAARKLFTLALMSSNWALRAVGVACPLASFAVGLQAEAQAA